MSTLQMLDVVIGIIFIFLLLSVICSAGNEIIEAILRKRSSDLNRGIRELLDGATDDPGVESIMEKLYKHPLVSGLFKGPYNSRSSRNLPSYIPSRSFALALLDVVMPATSQKLSGAAGGSNNVAAAKETLTSNMPDAPPAKDNEETDKNNANIIVSAGAPQYTAKNNPESPVEGLRASVVNMPSSNVSQALLTLIDAAGNDMNRVRENIEIWYNSSMDRVSGWYKRRVQWILLVLGLLIAMAMNADTIAIFKSLMKDEPLRNSLIAATSEYAKTGSKDSAQSQQNRVEANIRRLNDLRLPIGWDWDVRNNKEVSALQDNLKHGYVNNADLAMPSKAFWPWFFKILGWVITALAVSQGAPFWFDLLNKFMVARSTVKPREKSSGETS